MILMKTRRAQIVKERRSNERIPVEIPLALGTLPITIIQKPTTKDSPISLTNNISCSGLHCKLTHYIPPFTQVEVKLFLNPPGQVNSAPLSFRGVVVRTDPPEKRDQNQNQDQNQDQEYKVAIFVPSGIDLEDAHMADFLKYYEQSRLKD